MFSRLCSRTKAAKTRAVELRLCPVAIMTIDYHKESSLSLEVAQDVYRGTQSCLDAG